MIDFIRELKVRNETLFYFGLVCHVLAVLFLVLTKLSTTQVYNVNAWYKPLKFALSIGIYAWTMAWYCHYLPSLNIRFFNWAVIVLLGFEIVYIAIQAGRGQLSHFNVSTPIYGALYSMMALAASLVTIYTAYIGLLFFTNDIPTLPHYYLWAIRLGIIIFVVFSFEGFVMGSRLTHTIGGEDGGTGIPILNWSTKFGDPRIAHFIGMHALQVLPIVSFYWLKSTKATIVVALFYGILAVFTLVQALEGKPFLRMNVSDKIVNLKKEPNGD
jgi:hypothetical protein